MKFPIQQRLFEADIPAEALLRLEVWIAESGIIEVVNAWRTESGADVRAENGFRAGCGKPAAKLIRRVRAEGARIVRAPASGKSHTLDRSEIVLQISGPGVNRPVEGAVAVLVAGLGVIVSDADENFILLVEREDILEIHPVALGNGSREIVTEEKGRVRRRLVEDAAFAGM